MALDAAKPADTNLVSELPAIHRETRAAVNALETSISALSAVALAATVNIAGGTTNLLIGTDLSNVAFEVVIITGAGACVLATMTNGTAGQLKIFVCNDANITFDKGAAANGQFILNQPDHVANYGGTAGDVIALVNVGGDPGVDNGYWLEVWRTPTVN